MVDDDDMAGVSEALVVGILKARSVARFCQCDGLVRGWVEGSNSISSINRRSDGRILVRE